MRVMFVNSMRALGGGERWLLEVADGLASRGHDVSVAARTGSALARNARASGHRVLEAPMRGDADVDSVVRLAWWLRRHRVEILNVNIQRGVRLGCAAARLAGVRTVVERRGLTLPVKESAVNRHVYARCLTHVVANCRAIRDELVDAGTLPASRVSVIPNGIDPLRVPPGGGDALRAEFSIPSDAPLVAVIGRLVADKGHDVGLDAFRRLLVELPRARLLVVGAGNLEDRLRREALDFSGRSVVLAGHREDVPAVLDAADAVLVTSSREGMPHVVLESMAAGTPVVATRVAGVPELISDGQHGLLVPIGAADEAAGALLRVLSDRDLATRLGTQAAARVRAEFSLDQMIDRFEELFETLTGEH
ncbi:glycosyltransferase family 4 protein [bacterium]|nr:glycosyltransferase family 4 protein [bacterium]